MKWSTLLGFILILLFTECKKKKLVISNPGYTIGKIVFYKSKSPVAIDFSYYIGNKLYEQNYGNGTNGWVVPANGNYHSGDTYMAQYDLNNPQTCRFLFDYPVHDSTTYWNDVNYFKNHPPQ